MVVARSSCSRMGVERRSNRSRIEVFSQPCFLVHHLLSCVIMWRSCRALDNRSRVRLSAAPLSGAALGKLITRLCLCHSPSSIILLPAQTGNVPATVGLASHWPCVTDTVVYPRTGSTAYDREMSIEHPAYVPLGPGTL